MNNLLVTVASQFHLLPRPFHISNYSKFYIGTITELHFATRPTEGFISLPLNQSNFVIQRPYDVPEDQRYSCINGVHKLWVYSTDKPHSLISHTNPRTEIQMQVSLNAKCCMGLLHVTYVTRFQKPAYLDLFYSFN